MNYEKEMTWSHHHHILSIFHSSSATTLAQAMHVPRSQQAVMSIICIKVNSWKLVYTQKIIILWQSAHPKALLSSSIYPATTKHVYMHSKFLFLFSTSTVSYAYVCLNMMVMDMLHIVYTSNVPSSIWRSALEQTIKRERVKEN